MAETEVCRGEGSGDDNSIRVDSWQVEYQTGAHQGVFGAREGARNTRADKRPGVCHIQVATL